MKIFICASKYNYGYVANIKNKLEKMGHIDEPMKENEIKILGTEEHKKWKGNMIRLQKEKVISNDCIFVLNFEKNGQPNYIGGATFLEIYMAFNLDKKVYLYNPIPECNLKDELIGMGVEVVNGDLDKIV